MKFQSKKQKGRRLELEIAKLLRERLGVRASRMPFSGGIRDLEFKGDIFCPDLPFYFECKNQEKLRIWEWWQEIRNKKNPILVISGNNKPILVIMEFDNFLKMLELFIEAKKNRK